MWIAGIGWERDCGPEQFRWSRLGKLWYDKEQNRASILLNGFRFCDCIAKPFSNVTDLVELSGDIMVQTGQYEKDGQPKKELLKVGYISTSDNNGKVVYKVRLEAMPIIAPEFNEKGDLKQGLWCSVYLDSHERDSKPGTSTPSANKGEQFGSFDSSTDDTDLPF